MEESWLLAWNSSEALWARVRGGAPPMSEEETRNKANERRFFEEIWSLCGFRVEAAGRA